jgi:hypothetical protein
MGSDLHSLRNGFTIRKIDRFGVTYKSVRVRERAYHLVVDRKLLVHPGDRVSATDDALIVRHVKRTDGDVANRMIHDRQYGYPTLVPVAMRPKDFGSVVWTEVRTLQHMSSCCDHSSSDEETGSNKSPHTVWRRPKNGDDHICSQADEREFIA